MSKDKIFKEVVNQHHSAKRGFKESYCFNTKHNDIIFRMECTLRKHQSEQLSDQNKLAMLTKKINKRQEAIDKMQEHLEVANTITESDVGDAE